jgi:hypothetical protein
MAWENHHHQAVIVGDLLCIARLQGRHGRQEAAPLIHEAKDIGDIVRLDFGVEVLLQGFILFGLGAVPGQRFLDCIEV